MQGRTQDFFEGVEGLKFENRAEIILFKTKMRGGSNPPPPCVRTDTAHLKSDSKSDTLHFDSSSAKRRNRSSATSEPDVSALMFAVGRAMAVMSNSRRQRPALKVEHPDPEAVADEPNVGVDMDPENRGQENMGPPNRPPPPLPGRPRRSFHLYATRVVGLLRTTSNREEQH